MRSVTGVVLLSSNDEAECEMFAWKVRHTSAGSTICTQGGRPHEAT